MCTLGLLGYGWLDLDKLPINFVFSLGFALFDGLLGRAFGTSGEANESEATGAAGVAVLHNLSVGEGAELLKVFLQHLAGRVLRETANKDFRCLDSGMSTIGVMIFVSLMAGIGALAFHLTIRARVSVACGRNLMAGIGFLDFDLTIVDIVLGAFSFAFSLAFTCVFFFILFEF